MTPRDTKVVASILFWTIAAGPAMAGSTWRDPSPHRVRFIDVAPQTKVEVLDWGGKGEPLILLAGLGNTAHVFDDFAPKLRDHFHVFGMTRRGNGASSRPGTGYDIATLTDDLFAVVNGLGLKRVHLAGHSLGGEEINWFATHHADRLLKVVYLDAAYDRSVPPPDGPPAPPASRDEVASIAAFQRYRARISALQPEAEIRATVDVDADGRIIRNSTPPSVWAAVQQSLVAPPYASVRVPALAIYAVPEKPADVMPSFDFMSPENQQRTIDAFPRFVDFSARQRDKFRKEAPHAKILELRGATHYVFISREREVLAAIEEFLRSR